ncbi:MAG: acyl carrier protein, partial [Paraburkholderia sp.]|uniref:acyl carrier protein n=1 Tax=Paraburkholderia sp. TaxID=1926495 RepID=UPI0012188E3D
EALQARIGGASITSDEALAALERVLVGGGAGEAVVRLDWRAVSRGMPAADARRYILLHARQPGDAAREGSEQLREQVLALPREEAMTLVVDTLRTQIARILHMTPDRIALDRSILDLGMDSLMGMELGLAIEEAFEVKLSVMAIADGAVVLSLAARIIDSVIASEGGDAAGAESTIDIAAELAAKHAIDSHALAAHDAVGTGESASKADAIPLLATSADAAAGDDADAGVTLEAVR